MAGPRRHHPEAQRELRPRRHDAPGRAELRRGAGTLAHEIYGNVVTERHRHRYEANEHYLDRLTEAGPGDLGDHAAREADRDRRAAADRAPVVHRRAVPPRVQVDAVGRPPALQVVHPRRARAPGLSAPRRWRRESDSMKLCGFDVGLDQPVLPDRRPLRRRVRAVADGRGRPAEGDHRRARHPVHLQVELRQGEPLERHVVSRPRHGQGPRDPREGEARAEGAGADRRPPRGRDRRRRRGRRRAADAGVPVPADRFHPRRRAKRQAGEHQEGPVPRAARHEERDRQGARRGAREGPRGRQLHGLRTRRELRLQQPRLRHAQPRDHARDRRAGGLRRDPFGAAAGRPGHVVGRPARVRAGAGARGGRGRRRRRLHGNAPRPGPGCPTARTRCR